ncbi:Pr6Pr family membrane protein [Chitinophaga sp. Mgbs1]|uniref:Pr6Pr family membrane protein n=1 Tax=Chitinophaga solisilvae TaxID=1233460 RepID=A0A3S1CYW6_9BACT|nr:Pr6Pr family membrane protein [Chitinophaga solisilvae]
MKIFSGIIAVSGWFALIAQAYIMFTGNAAPLPELIIRFFSYFTITTNLLVAICSTVLFLAPETQWGRFFSKPATLTAITVYITIVGLIYNIILRSLWSPQGLQYIVDELLHTVIPAMFILYWGLTAAKTPLPWNSCWPWLIYPLAYIVWVLIRGAFSGFYPYPFIHVGTLGMQQTLINAVGIGVLFAVVSLAFIGIGRWISGKRLS